MGKAEASGSRVGWSAEGISMAESYHHGWPYHPSLGHWEYAMPVGVSEGARAWMTQSGFASFPQGRSEQGLGDPVADRARFLVVETADILEGDDAFHPHAHGETHQ